MRLGIAVRTVKQAERVIKRLELVGDDNEDDYRFQTREALKNIIQERMKFAVSEHLEEMSLEEIPDRRNGSYSRCLLTEIGNIELNVPRTRRYCAGEIIKSYARRAKQIDHLILACFILGLATRKVGKALLVLLGEKVSASTVSRVARVLDEAVAAFHRRALKDIYRVLVFDGVVLSRKTGAGALKRPVLVVLGIRPDGKKEIIDYRLSSSESESEWEIFMTDLYKRGLVGEKAELVCVDGGKGLLSALQTVYPNLPVQRCWAHKTRNLTDMCRKNDREAVKKGIHTISHAKNRIKAMSNAGDFARIWGEKYPKIIKSLRNDLENLLEFFRFEDDEWRKKCRTTNSIERRFREVRRRTRPMGVFQDKTSMDRILYAVFNDENENQKTNAPFLLTHNI